MGIQAGVGMSHHRNPTVAGQEATQKALEAAGVDKPDFVFMFASMGYNQQSLLNAVREATGGAPLCGCSGEGVIAGGEADESNFSVAVMAISSDHLRFSHGMTTGLNDDPAKAGRAIAEAIQPEVSADTLTLFIFPDGSGTNVDRLLLNLEGQLELDHLLPVVGGKAGNIPNRGMLTCQYYNDQVISDGVAWVLLSGQAQITWAVNHGYVPVSVEHTVTRCEENLIYEVDGRPVLKLLKDDYFGDLEIGDRSVANNFFGLALKAPKHMQAYDDYIIRGFTIEERDDGTGFISLEAEVSKELTEGMSLWVAHRDYEKLTDGVDRVAEEIKGQLGDNPARLVFQFECVARGKGFLREQQKLHLLETLQERIGPDAPWLGFYSFGEIAPVGGHNYYHQYTVVLAAIYE